MDFAYHRSLAPMMWVLFALACVEMIVLHLLLALWKPWVAAIVSLVSLAGIIWIVLLIRSFPRLPVRIADGVLIMRAGRLRSATIPFAQIDGLRVNWDAAAIKDRSVLNLALIAWPNIVVDLAAPMTIGRRSVAAVAHRLDDPAAFAAAIERLERGHD